MEAEKFTEILGMVKNMDSQQRFTLFHEIEKTEEIMIPYYVSRVNVEEYMEGYVDDPKPLTDKEWEDFSKKVEEYGSVLRSEFIQLETDILDEIRPNWNEES